MEMTSVEKVRIVFRIRSKMVKKIRLNFKNMYRSYECQHCDGESQESQAHAKMCPGWEEERSGLDLEQLEDTVEFFTRILKEKGRQNGEGRT